jgi:acetyl-CoA carboxylase biotin carboxyl carrier protein
MDLKEIQELLHLLDSTTAIEEFEMEGSDFKIRVKKSTPRSVSVTPSGSSLLVGHGPSEPARKEPAENLYSFKAPIVGTFYSTPKPDAEPFVRVGDPVRKGMVICIIEAMKLFNQIECDVDGTVARMLVESGQPVEFGEPLFEIRLAL